MNDSAEDTGSIFSEEKRVQTPDEIRLQMEETKTQLTDKLVSLEHQVTETVQSTGDAVNATVEAVHETVESVTGAVQSAAHSISEAFDINKLVDKNPILMVGGALVLGYLAGDLLGGPGKRSRRGSSAPGSSAAFVPSVQVGNTPIVEPDAMAAALAAAYDSGRQSVTAPPKTGGVLSSLFGYVQNMATNALPQLMDAFVANQVSSTEPPRDSGADRSSAPASERPVGSPGERSTRPVAERNRFNGTGI